MYRRKNPVKYIILIPFLLILTVSGCGRNQKIEFNRLADAYVNWYLKMHPVSATQIGFHEYDGEFGKFDEESTREKLADLKRFNIEMTQIDPLSLDLDHRIDYQILSSAIDEMIFEITDLRVIEWNPRLVPSIIGSGIYSLIEREFAPMEKRVSSLESRLSKIPELVQTIQSTLKSAPTIYLETAISQTEGLINTLKVLPLEIYTDNTTFDRIDEHIRKAVYALSQYKFWLLDGPLKDHPRDFRIGKELYEKKFLFSVNEGATAEQLLNSAKNAIIDTQDKMFNLAMPIYLIENDEPVWVSRKDTLSVINWVLDKIADDHVNRDEVVYNVKKGIDDITSFIVKNSILDLNSDNALEIREMPEYMRGVSIANLDAPGALEKNLKTYYNVSPIPEDWTNEQSDSFLREYNNYSVQILNIHEALPGHYVQLYHAGEHPSKIRAIFSSGTMIEGWAHYCEGMMINEGFGKNDPKMKIVQYKWALRGMINVIIDQEIHTQNMSKAEAIELMVTEGFQELSEAEGKWIRAQLTFCQLSTYYAGTIKMWNLRRQIEQKEGENFDLRSFHDRLLSHGSISIKFLSDILLDM
ncbi:MAG: DUF885 domain-containing protein [Candidatus Marinimicrobia bacterium]|jgi:hypothetical protein|nr:DUF885 domain-containing protein [Candidatus Neomarinimicrobiota bacterium]MBT3634338.1 DUF885 domain-containing protein [Candidatus Neomarinimicrobiota bacterium]MBT3681753.1 DUF885 domain-containing protein [Candidatus Neomarinimicrobiota bacterium]MBT3759479.1 DUF885 domain-containing protein [Candidatus Neomarinimicrobiota bacterium]MBT3895967.1 DUF885 domain-containing protein [Candidatus Neomarinimicrobiota bacterium]